MEPVQQQRLIGAIVLVALAVIIIPALLDGSGYKSRHEKEITIPPKPEFPVLVEKKVKPVESPVDQRKKQIQEKKKSESKPPKVGKETKKPIEGWVVQVGTFSNKENAHKLRDDIRKKKHHAFVEKQDINGKTNFRVRVGPFITRKAADAMKDRLAKSMKLKGYVVKHP